MRLSRTVEKVFETKQVVGAEGSNMYKPLSRALESIDDPESMRIERVKYPYGVYTLTIFLAGCRGVI